MKPLIPLFLLISLTLPAQGVYRWDVKIAIDTAGQRIAKTKYKPIATSVSDLASKKENPRPEKKEIQKGLRADKEKRKVTVTAYLVGLGKEKDGDYHLILKALRGKKTLVAEIPDPNQPKLKGFPTYKKQYAKARQVIDEDVKVPTSTIKEIEPVKVIVTGFVFFDIFEEGGHGHGTALENAIEIHPVLKIKVVK